MASSTHTMYRNSIHGSFRLQYSPYLEQFNNPLRCAVRRCVPKAPVHRSLPNCALGRTRLSVRTSIVLLRAVDVAVRELVAAALRVRRLGSSLMADLVEIPLLPSVMISLRVGVRSWPVLPITRRTLKARVRASAVEPFCVHGTKLAIG